MQHSTGNRRLGASHGDTQHSGPRDGLGSIAPHRAPRLDTRNAAALIRRPVIQPRGGTFLPPSGASRGTSAIALPGACSDQHDGVGTLYGRHVATDRFPRGGWGSDALATFFARRVAGQPLLATGYVRRMPQGLRSGAGATVVGASASYTATASPVLGECIRSLPSLTGEPRLTRGAGSGWGGRNFFAGVV